MTDLDAVFAYGPAPREVPGSESHMISIDQVARQMPTTSATPTPLPDLSSLTLLGKDDGSLQPKLPQISSSISFSIGICIDNYCIV